MLILLTRLGLLSLRGTIEARYKVRETRNIMGRQDQSSRKLGISVGSYNLGCFVGAIATIWLGDLLGRRKTIFLGSSIMVVGATLQCTSFSLAQLIVGRIVTG